MDTGHPHSPTSLANAEGWLALGAGAALLLTGASRRSAVGALLAASAAPLLYRGLTGRWPGPAPARANGGAFSNTREALGGERGIHVRESIQVNVPPADAYACWRWLQDLPRFMTHLERVTVRPDGTSHWVAAGPGGLSIEWDAEILNDVENRLLAWRSLAGSDVVTAGSVNFDAARNGQSTHVRVHLQYAPPAGKAGAFIASLFGREPSRTIREDLRRFRHLLETGRTGHPAATA